jgi:integrase
MTRLHLKFIHRFRDRHGTLRHYFRRPGFKRLPLPGLPGSSEFMSAYEDALAGATAVGIEIGSARTKPGTAAAATVAYFGSAAFQSLAPQTREARRRILERFRSEHGDKPIPQLTRKHVVNMVAAKSATPAAAHNFLKALRGLMQHCVLLEMRADDPTQGVKGPKIKTDGFYSWAEADIEKFESVHALGSRARLALSLLLYSGARRGDVIRMGRQHVRDGILQFAQQKTGGTVALPVDARLVAAIEATPSDNLTFLVTEAGSPFTAGAFSNWFRRVCNEAGLPRCSAHGLRKAALRRLAESGCPANQIAAVGGHRSLREVARYTAAADREKMAKAAMETMARAFPAKK